MSRTCDKSYLRFLKVEVLNSGILLIFNHLCCMLRILLGGYYVVHLRSWNITMIWLEISNFINVMQTVIAMKQ